MNFIALLFMYSPSSKWDKIRRIIVVIINAKDCDWVCIISALIGFGRMVGLKDQLK